MFSVRNPSHRRRGKGFMRLASQQGNYMSSIPGPLYMMSVDLCVQYDKLTSEPAGGQELQRNSSGIRRQSSSIRRPSFGRPSAERSPSRDGLTRADSGQGRLASAESGQGRGASPSPQPQEQDLQAAWELEVWKNAEEVVSEFCARVVCCAVLGCTSPVLGCCAGLCCAVLKTALCWSAVLLCAVLECNSPVLECCAVLRCISPVLGC